MKKALLFSFLSAVFSISAHAYEFSFESTANIFESEEETRKDMIKQIDKINKSYLLQYGLQAKIISVNGIASKTVQGEMTGLNCTVSTSFYQRIDISNIPYPVGVEVNTLRGIGLIYSNDGAGRTLMIPYCAK